MSKFVLIPSTFRDNSKISPWNQFYKQIKAPEKPVDKTERPNPKRK